MEPNSWQRHGSIGLCRRTILVATRRSCWFPQLKSWRWIQEKQKLPNTLARQAFFRELLSKLIVGDARSSCELKLGGMQALRFQGLCQEIGMALQTCLHSWNFPHRSSPFVQIHLVDGITKFLRGIYWPHHRFCRINLELFDQGGDRHVGVRVWHTTCDVCWWRQSNGHFPCELPTESRWKIHKENMWTDNEGLLHASSQKP